MSSETLSTLLQDLNRLYNEADDYDVNIQVGEGSNIETFKAHSAILRIRSPYFNAALSSNWAEKEENVIAFKKPNIKPNVFRIILKYIYTGTIALDANVVKMNLIELLVAADEINLSKLVDYIQEHIITLNEEWFKNNGIKLINTLSYHQGVFKILHEYFINNNPKIFLNSSNLFSGLEKDGLLSLIQNDNFKMEEIEIWDNLIKWAIAKNPTVSSDISHWTSEEMEVIRQTIQQFIPHIRFFQISSRDYYYKIRPLSALLPKELDEDLILYFLVPESLPVSKVLPPRISPINIDSKIIKVDHIYQIAYWIDKKQGEVYHFSNEIKYEFKLLLHESENGFNEQIFKKKCYNKGATLIVIKLKGEDKIIGGYNPIYWSGINKMLETNDSFIFSFQSVLNSSTTILSRVKIAANAIYDSDNDTHSFGDYDLEIFRKKCEHKQYETSIIESNEFEGEEYEVFQVVEKE